MYSTKISDPIVKISRTITIILQISSYCQIVNQNKTEFFFLCENNKQRNNNFFSHSFSRADKSANRPRERGFKVSDYPRADRSHESD